MLVGPSGSSGSSPGHLGGAARLEDIVVQTVGFGRTLGAQVVPAHPVRKFGHYL